MGTARDWYRTAKVRASAGPAALSERDGAWFPSALLPYVEHPRVLALNAAAELQKRALARYLQLTDVLELNVVSPVALELSQGAWHFASDDATRIQARQLFCDEAYHALWAAELSAQLEARATRPAFVQRLQGLQERHPRDARLLRFLFTVVSETAITQTLVDLLRSRDVQPAVRELAAAHAADEARHGAFFSELFARLWEQLPPPDRDRLGAMLPSVVRAFLAPDVDAINAELCEVGLSERHAAQVLAETLPESVVRRSMRRAAVPVLTCFRRGGALDREVFLAANLLEGEA